MGKWLLSLLMLSLMGWAGPGRNAMGAEIKFATAPTAAKAGAGGTVAFAVAAKTDVEVAVLNAKGEAVRHLAAGVLGGEKPPPEPLKAGLSQSLTWDGNDDFGKKAEGGPFKFRVRAGSQFQFGRFVGEDPYTSGSVDGLCTDEDGSVYVSSYAGTHNQGARTVRAYDAAGEYLRELLPFPSNLKPDAMKEVARFDEPAKLWRPRSTSCLLPEFYGSAGMSLLSVSQSNGMIFADSNDVYALNVDGSVKGSAFGTQQRPWPVFDAKDANNDHYGHPWHYNDGITCFAASPDGKWLYLTGPYPNAEMRKKPDPRFPLGGVYRMRLDGKDQMKLFATLPATFEGPWAKPGGANYGKSSPIHFVGCDSKNNVYVPDREANRVVVFSEDGKQTGEFPCKNPHQIVVNPKTNAIYVLRLFCDGYCTHKMMVERFEASGATYKSTSVYDKFANKVSPRIAIAAGKDRSILWVAGLPEGVMALEDKGGVLTPTTTAYKPRDEAQIDWNRLAVDYGRDEVYVADGGNQIWRYDGKTGQGGILKTKDGKPLPAVDLAVGYDELLYIRTGASFSGPLERYTHELEPAPLKSGTHVISPYIYSRFGVGNCEKGMGVGPKGEVYISFLYTWVGYAVGGFNGDGKAMPGLYLPGKFPSDNPESLKQYPPDLRTAMIGPITDAGGGIRVDLQGNVYLGLDVKPDGYKPPAYFAGNEVGSRWSASVVKFGPKGGAVLGVKNSESKLPDAPKIALEGKMTAENAIGIYPGLGPLSGGGPGGNSSCCVCRVPRFDVDRYGRLAIPGAYSATLLYYDNAGNLISEVGGYGNFDSMYVNPNTDKGKAKKPTVDAPNVPLTWPTGAGFSENHIYINDTYSRRVVRVDKTFGAEAVCELK